MKFLVILLVASRHAAMRRSAVECLPQSANTTANAPKRKACFQKLTAVPNPAVARKGSGESTTTRTRMTRFARPSPQQPEEPDLRVRWGRLFLERFNTDEAQTAVQRSAGDQTGPRRALPRHWLSCRRGFEQQAVELAQKALEARPEAGRSAGTARSARARRQQSDEGGRGSGQGAQDVARSARRMAIHAADRLLPDKKRQRVDRQDLAINPSTARHTRSRPLLRPQPPLRRRHRRSTARRSNWIPTSMPRARSSAST